MRRTKRARAILSGAEKKLAELDAADPERKPDAAPIVVVMKDDEIVIRSPSDRIPDHVWRTLARSGESAVTRLEGMLNERNFDKLKGSEKIALIRLGIEYAFGKPEAPVKRVITANVGDNVDAVFASMQRLASKAALPEYKDLVGVADAVEVEEDMPDFSTED